MKITRTINGQKVEIELTAEERYSAYIEEKRDLDISELYWTWQNICDDEEIERDLTEDEVEDALERYYNRVEWCDQQATEIRYEILQDYLED